MQPLTAISNVVSQDASIMTFHKQLGTQKAPANHNLNLIYFQMQKKQIAGYGYMQRKQVKIKF